MMKRLLALIIVLTPIASQAFDLPWSENARIEKCKAKIRESSQSPHTLKISGELNEELDAGYSVELFADDSKASHRLKCYFDKNSKMIDYKWH